MFTNISDKAELDIVEAMLNITFRGLNTLSAGEYFGDSFEGQDEKVLNTINKIKSAVDRERDHTERNEKDPLTEDQMQHLGDLLEYYIIHKRPCDLVENHRGGWFIKNDRGQVLWNWRNQCHPLSCLAHMLGLIDNFNNTPNFQCRRIVDNVKKRASIKPIKNQTFKE